MPVAKPIPCAESVAATAGDGDAAGVPGAHGAQLAAGAGALGAGALVGVASGALAAAGAGVAMPATCAAA